MTPATTTEAEAVSNAHAWFEVNSGWAPPDDETLAEWHADGVCRAPDECAVVPDGWCEHGLASWTLILATVDLRHDRASPLLRVAEDGVRELDIPERADDCREERLAE